MLESPFFYLTICLLFQPIFQRYPRPEKEYQSFSLIYNDRSLDLVRFCLRSPSSFESTIFGPSIFHWSFNLNFVLFFCRYAKTRRKLKSGLVVLRHWFHEVTSVSGEQNPGVMESLLELLVLEHTQEEVRRCTPPLIVVISCRRCSVFINPLFWLMG